jgi:hypothetical protein
MKTPPARGAGVIWSRNETPVIPAKLVLREGGGAGIEPLVSSFLKVRRVDSRSPAFAEDKLRGNDCDREHPYRANDTIAWHVV